MIGNDIVDIGDAECLPGARHTRFDARVFCPSELTLLGDSADPDRTRWMLWAAKESAYKAARRLDPRIVFAPSRFVVELRGDGRGTVTAGGLRFCIDLVATREYIHAVAYLNAVVAARSCAAVARLDSPGHSPDQPSVAARRLAVATLAEVLEVAPSELAISRDGHDGRMPALHLRGALGPIALSLSHHGRFVAFACAPAA